MPTSSGLGAARSDAELIHASTSDPAAFEMLVERHAMLLDRWLTAKTGDAAIAHELMAETFAQAWRGARRFRGTGDATGAAWLYGIARNLLRQHFRKGRLESAARRRLGMAASPSHDDEADDIGYRIDARQLSPAIRKAFDELTPDQQRAIAYRVLDELSYEEIAAELSCSTSTARSRVFRGLRTLRATIAKGAHP